jgi:2-amino-4-hydroxy-6-hydroxymethyldihydropteridine diphosphokinase
MAGEPWFLNTVVEADTLLAPQELLEICQTVEEENLRKRKKESRTLDIDIIFYGDWILKTPSLTIPHPEFHNRRFVLEPLAEIAPDFVDPVSRKSVRHLLENVNDPGGIYLFAPPLRQKIL